MAIDIKDIHSGFNKEDNESSIIKTVDLTEHDSKWHRNTITSYTKSIEPDFLFNENAIKLYKGMFMYFTGNKGLNLNKGIWLYGDTGCGKSLVFDVFKAYTMHIIKVNSFRCYLNSKIIDDFKRDGSSTLEKFDWKGKETQTVYIDDLFNKTSTVNHFQNFENLSESIIDIRYRMFQRGKLTHVTSNFSPAETDIDGRSIGRASEMFNIIKVENDNFRLSK